MKFPDWRLVFLWN